MSTNEFALPEVKDLNSRHPSTQHMIIRLRPNVHLKDNYKAIADQIFIMAVWLTNLLPDSPELTAGLRKLLEAKDCFVRAAVLKDAGSDMNKSWND